MIPLSIPKPSHAAWSEKKASSNIALSRTHHRPPLLLPLKITALSTIALNQFAPIANELGTSPISACIWEEGWLANLWRMPAMLSMHPDNHVPSMTMIPHHCLLLQNSPIQNIVQPAQQTSP